MTRTKILALALLLATTQAKAEYSDNIIRIGVLNDISGVFSDTNGPGSVLAARMAAEDFAGGGKNIQVEIISGDHQNKPDVGSTLVRRWIDVDHVDAVVDVPNSAVGLAVNTVLRNSRATFLASSTASSDLTGAACSPNTVQWVTDTWSIGHAAADAMMRQGGKSWYFLTVNYALGEGIEREATSFITQHGGTVVGAARHPLGTSDFSSFLLQAQASGAQVIGLANAGADTINALKQAAEFGIGRNGSQSLVAFLAFINDIQGAGLDVAQGLLLTEGFYWDLNDDTRAWSRRFAARLGGKMPSTNQAGVYAATSAYLAAAAATGSDDAKLVVPEMKKSAFQDKLFGAMSIRADGRAMHAMHLFQVKSPKEVRYPWDYYTERATIPAEQAFKPMDPATCAMVR